MLMCVGSAPCELTVFRWRNSPVLLSNRESAHRAVLALIIGKLIHRVEILPEGWRHSHDGLGVSAASFSSFIPPVTGSTSKR